MGKGTVVEITRPEVSRCRHHWLIESPHGAVSRGRCKICGAQREFRNSAPGAMWEDDSSTELGTWRKSRPVAVTTDDDEMSMADTSGKGKPALAL